MAENFGPYSLDLEKRILTKDGAPLELPPKTFDLLLLLVRSKGTALSKEVLMDALWPGTSVQEASLTFQISTLRKALGPPASQWIENLPRYGYRFAGPQAAPQAALPRRRLTPWALGAAGVLAVAGAVFFRPPKEPVGAVPIVPVTSYRGMEIHPSLSPDASQVAFSWNGPQGNNFDIYVKLTGAGEPIRLTTNPVPEFAPAWSPDGQTIAFLRSGPAPDTVSVLTIPALGGAERRLVELQQPLASLFMRQAVPNANLTWTPDGKYLVASGRRIRRSELPAQTNLTLIDAQTGETRNLTEPQWSGDFAPAISPDGRYLAYVRLRSLSVTEIWLLPLDRTFAPAGDARLLVKATSIGELQWIPDTREIVYSSSMGSTRRLWRLSTKDAEPKPQALTFGENATAISIARNGTLVYSQRLRDSNIWRMETDGRGSLQTLAASTHDDREPHYSPDGSRLVFTSTRSGTDEIWMANADGSNPAKLTNIQKFLTSNPQWSPDGRQIVFDSRSAPDGGSELHLIDVATLQQRQAQTGGAQPRWSRDGKWIYFAEPGGQVWKIQPETGARSQVTRGGGFVAQESSDGRYIYFAKGRPAALTLWRMPAGGDSEEKLIASDLAYSTSFCVTAEGVYFVSRQAGMPSIAAVQFFDIRTGTTTKLLDTGKPPSFGISVHPKSSQVAFALMEFDGADLLRANRIE